MLILPFMDPGLIKTMMKQRISSAMRNKKPFDEIKPPRRIGEDVGIIASTFLPDNPMDKIFPLRKGMCVTSPSGRLKYTKQLLPEGSGLAVTSSKDLWHDNGRAFFDDAIRIPTLLFKDERSGWDVWMSLTPMEMWTQRAGVRAATGNVVLGGLGMGWLLNQIAAKKTVKDIVVVEKDEELMEWFGNKLCEAVPKVSKIIVGDVFEHTEEFDKKKTKFIIDVWANQGDARYDHRLAKLKKSGARVWAWGDRRR